MNASDIRQSFLDFFRGKEHTIVPSSSLLPSSPNLLFTNAGMNQFVPYFLGEQRPPFSPARVADTQKCIRAGGKHNDLDDVGFDTYHHTFFEMLGNWSFGDYFKREAISWAWELVVEHWRFPPFRLYATVYRPGEGDPASFDQESYDVWATLFESVGLDPKVHVLNGTRKDNFWMMGDTGPCGPCSEIHFDLTPEGNTAGKLVNLGSPLCIEIWNLVFIQFNANLDGNFSPLPARHVDTGMGFERVAGIIECTDQFRNFETRISNYESDLFRPIFLKLAELSQQQYLGTIPTRRSNLTSQEKVDVAFRVIGDHIRTLSFAIADGIIPGNTDRNYVIRRILRRAILHGRYLGLGTDGFLSKLVSPVVNTLSPAFPELQTQENTIVEVLDNEEALFNRTLDRGLRILEDELINHTEEVFSPDTAFKLYDTYGFPVDLTEVLVRDRGLTLDLAAVEDRMTVQRDRSRAAREKDVIAAVEQDVPTQFVGFDQDEAEAKLVRLVTQGDELLALVDRSPFYAEMGGQISDTGELIYDGSQRMEVTGVAKRGNSFYLKLGDTLRLETPAEVLLKIDQSRRRKIEANHTVTHLLHWALHEVVSRKLSQKGSLVAADRLRFDFNSAPLTADQVREIEQLVNQRIIDNHPVSWLELPFNEVKTRPEIMQFFGEKYGAEVRVVQIGGHVGKLDGYSMELCGGTHVLWTGQIGLFTIVSEGAIAAGIRRIEALTGLAALQYLHRQLDDRASRIFELTRDLMDARKALEKEKVQSIQREAEQYVATLGTDPAKPVIKILEGKSGDFLQAVALRLKARKFGGLAILFGRMDQEINLVVAVGPEKLEQYHASKIVQELIGLVGGKGGGRADQARGVGQDTTKLMEAIKLAEEIAGRC